MVSFRCRDLSLYNHFKQTNKIKDLKLEQIFRKDYKGEPLDCGEFKRDDSWISILTFNNSKFISCDTTKKRSKKKVLIDADSKLRELL
tara:strand:- start:21 stop:284 length:264 start_codon:yes stop_codon:yes gene_type:complete